MKSTIKHLMIIAFELASGVCAVAVVPFLAAVPETWRRRRVEAQTGAIIGRDAA